MKCQEGYLTPVRFVLHLVVLNTYMGGKSPKQMAQITEVPLDLGNKKWGPISSLFLLPSSLYATLTKFVFIKLPHLFS